MPNYRHGKVYRLSAGSDGSGEIYVGATTARWLCRRMAVHRQEARCGNQSKVYQYMREVGIQNFHIDLLEPCPCENVDQLNEREEYWRKKLGAKLNSQRAVGKNRAYFRRYYLLHRDIILARHRRWLATRRVRRTLKSPLI